MNDFAFVPEVLPFDIGRCTALKLASRSETFSIPVCAITKAKLFHLSHMPHAGLSKVIKCISVIEFSVTRLCLHLGSPFVLDSRHKYAPLTKLYNVSRVFGAVQHSSDLRA